MLHKQYCKRHLTVRYHNEIAKFLPFSGCHELWIPRMVLFFSLCLPSRKAGGLQIPCCQGIAVADYSFTLDALALKPSSFCNVGVYAVSCVFSAIGVIHKSISMGCRPRGGKLPIWWKMMGVDIAGIPSKWHRTSWPHKIAPWNGFHWYWPPENHCWVARINMDSTGIVCITDAEEALGYKKDIRFPDLCLRI